MSPVERLIEGLPPFVCVSNSSLSSGYGADVAVARYCGLKKPPLPPLGLWQHGWAPQHFNFDPTFVIGADGSYDAVKAKETFWVARRDQEEYLQNHGYLHAKAIGLPLVYLPEQAIERIPNTLLVMPVHSLEYTTHKWNFEEYVDSISQIRHRFEDVVICIHPACWKRGYWVNEFQKQGFTTISGASGADSNGLLRLQMLLRSFEFVTTNGFGSHIAYAAYFGAKPSIFGTYADFGKSDYNNTQLYQSCPYLLEPALEAVSEPVIRQHYPFLFAEPDKAQSLQSWGESEVGSDCKLPPGEIKQLFGWAQPQVSLRVARSLGTRAARKTGRIAKKAGRLALTPHGREEWKQFRSAVLSPAAAGTVTLLGKPFQFVNGEDFLFVYDEIWRNQIYRFATADKEPLIIDGGSNTGLSVLYFKQLYPQSRVLGFEPDPELFDLLQANGRAQNWENVELFQQALWTENGSLTFNRQGSLGGRLAHSGENEDATTVPTRRLRDLLGQKVAFLKLDIEGAETEVLEDCRGALDNVEHIFVEYHSFVDRPQTLSRLLSVVEDAGFRVHVHVYQPSAQPLFLRDIRQGMDLVDMNLDIFCFRV